MPGKARVGDGLTDPCLRTFLSNNPQLQRHLANFGLLRTEDKLLLPISERRLDELERVLERCPALTGAAAKTKEESDAERATRLEVSRKIEALRVKKLRIAVKQQREKEKEKSAARRRNGTA
jgi:hypothetical protein